MLAGSVVCVSGRLGSLRLSGVRLPRHLSLQLQTRSLTSLGLQRNRFPLPRHTLLASAASSRSFWWSPKATPSVQETSLSKEQSIAPEPVSPVEFATEPPAEASALAESTGITEATPLPDPSILPDIPAEVLSAIPLPLQYGDLAALGLAGWSPAGLCRWGMEIIQVSTGMPWIWAIVAATFATRLFLFPFQVKTMRNTAALAPHQDALAALRQEIMNAQKSGDPLAMQQAILKQRMVYERIGVSMGSMALMPFVQLPVTLGMFFAIKKLCDLPLEQLKWSGVDILPDLTAADPTHVLPVLCAVGMNIQLSLGMRDMNASPQVPHMINLFRALSVAGVFFMMNLPSGVVVYLLASIGSLTLQTIILRIPAVRRVLRIPQVPENLANKPASFKESFEYLKKWWEDKKAEEIAKKTRRR